MREKTHGQKLVHDYLAKHPDMPTLTAAKILYGCHPKAFASIEGARNMIRYARGLNGVGKLYPAVISSPLRKEPGWLDSLPVSDSKKPIPYDLNTIGTGTVIADLHIPHHERVPLAAMLDYSCAKGATDFLIILGDLLDCYMESRFEKNPDMRDFPGERKLTIEFLEAAVKWYKRVIVKEGNHEARHNRLLLTKAPELYGLDELTMPSLLHLDELGVDWVGGKVPIRVGHHLSLWHGHEFPVAGMVNPARGLYNRIKACAIVGHCHRTSSHSEVHHDATRTPVSCWSIGCASELAPDYSPINNYNHGMLILSVGRDAKWQVEGNYKVIGGRVMGS